MGKNTRNNVYAQDLIAVVTVNQYADYYYVTNTC